MTYSRKGSLARLILVSLFVCPLASCLGPKMINKWVAHHYSPEALQPTKKKSDLIAITSKLPEPGPQPSETESHSHVLPLIVYWKFDYRNTCTLNSQIDINGFTTAINTYGGRLKSKLNGGRLELTIQQMPTVFVLDDRGWDVLFLVSAEYLSIQPTIADLVVSYRQLDANNTEVKSGRISIPDPDRARGLKMFHSLKKMTYDYLDEYDEHITSMSRKFVDKLAGELSVSGG